MTRFEAAVVHGNPSCRGRTLSWPCSPDVCLFSARAGPHDSTSWPFAVVDPPLRTHVTRGRGETNGTPATLGEREWDAFRRRRLVAPHCITYSAWSPSTPVHAPPGRPLRFYGSRLMLARWLCSVSVSVSLSVCLSLSLCVWLCSSLPLILCSVCCGRRTTIVTL